MQFIVAQAKPVLGDFTVNLSQALKYSHWACNLGAQLLVLPELFSTGYIPEDLLFRDAYIQSLMRQIDYFAQDIRHIAVLMGSPWKVHNALYNSCLFIADGAVQHVTHKSFLPNDSVFDEYRYFTPVAPNASNNIITIHNKPYIVAICHDLWCDAFAHSLSNTRANWSIAINASPYYLNKAQLREEVAMRFCKTTATNLLYCNQVMMHDSILYEGGSFVMSYTNDNHCKTWRCSSYQEQLMQVFIDDQQNSACLTVNNFNVYSDFVEQGENNRVIKSNSELASLDELYSALVFGIREYFNFHNFHCAYIALSGGIDSALSALLACDALGQAMVRTVYMPTRFNSIHSATDSSAIAAKLQTKHTIVEIDSIFEHYHKLIMSCIYNASSGVTDGSIQITLQNIQARIRGDIIMSFANTYNGLVLGTSNKSELACGYATLYGDMACGLNPLKDLYKTDVYDLVKFRNQNIPQNIQVYNNKLDFVPDNVLYKKPSAELRDAQYDEQDLPEYSILDKILKNYLEDADTCHFITDETAARVIKMIGASEFKRKQAPPGIKVRKASFDKERRYPIMLKHKALLY